MKNILLICLLFLSNLCTAQSSPKWNWNKAAGIVMMGYVGGAAYGTHEMINHHKDDAAKLIGKRESWDPDYTWKNKYKNDDPAQGEKYFGSTNVLAWTTDWDHATATISNLSIVGMGFTIGLSDFDQWDKRSKKDRRKIIVSRLAYAAIGYTSRALGFHTIYTVLPNLNK